MSEPVAGLFLGFRHTPQKARRGRLYAPVQAEMDRFVAYLAKYPSPTHPSSQRVTRPSHGEHQGNCILFPGTANPKFPQQPGFTGISTERDLAPRKAQIRKTTVWNSLRISIQTRRPKTSRFSLLSERKPNSHVRLEIIDNSGKYLGLWSIILMQKAIGNIPLKIFKWLTDRPIFVD
jgi:hypothetical protein